MRLDSTVDLLGYARWVRDHSAARREEKARAAAAEAVEEAAKGQMDKPTPRGTVTK